MAALTGAITGILIFLFKAAASKLISISEEIHNTVRSNSTYIPLLIAGMAAIGLISAIILKYIPDARGGGIPTAIAILRGLIPFKWIKSIIFVFISAMLTYFGGVPLGNEGPSVQMGTAVGRGTVSLFAKKHRAWDRYIMTGGACAGFAAATGSPITGLLFAFEEAHRRISPTIFIIAATSTLAGVSVSELLCQLTNTRFSLFNFNIECVLPLQYIWTAIIIGLFTGFIAAGFSGIYQKIRHFIRHTLKAVPRTVKIVAIFVLSTIAGVISADCIGSGHNLIETISDGQNVTFALIGVFVVRAALLLFANNADITGGLFVPTLTFGAVIGALCGKAMILIGILPEQYYPITVIIGIAAYLGSSSRTPLIALAFATEALCGMTNILPVATAVTVSFLVIEALGIKSFTDTVIEHKTDSYRNGQKAYIIETDLTVEPNSFACGKEVRDIILPPTCVILAIQKDKTLHIPTTTLSAGDIIQVHFRTFDPTETMEQLEAVVGKQKKNLNLKISFEKQNQHIPDM